MPRYDDSFFQPAAPVAEAILRDPSTGKVETDVMLLLDTGADVTLLPIEAVKQLGIDIESADEYQLMAFDGSITISRAVRVDLVLLKKTFKGKYLVSNQEYGILGRDILNHLSIKLDGPNLNWSEDR